MSSVPEMWGQVAARWNEVTDQIGEADWNKPSTCDGWCVKDVVEHAMGWQTTGAKAFGAELADDADWATVQSSMAAALSDPSNLEGTAEAFGNMPKQGVAGLVIGDLLLHTWDVARSIGVDETLPEDVVTSTMMGLQRLPEPMLRGETMFGPAIEVADDASAQDKLLGFVGRQP